MVRKILSALLIFSFISGCSKKETPVGPSTGGSISDAEYSIFSNLADSLVVSPSHPIIVLGDSTAINISGTASDSVLTVLLEYVKQHIPSLLTGTMLDFKAKNQTPTYIDDPARIHPTCRRRSEVQQTFPSLQVSRVGFSPDGRQALVYAGVVYAPLAGAGMYYALSLENGRWVTVGSVMIWIS